MDSKRWQELKKILDDVSEVAEGERDVFLREACGDDSELLRELRSFLAFEEDLSTFIERPLFSLGSAGDKNVGRRIGHYRLGRPLGQGGMGSVYLAVREDDFEQKAALKLIHPGMHSGEILDRFLNERQILAQLEHPNIARLLDGGTTDDGLPYFVLEYVDGEPLDEYCESRRLPVGERLELFRQICAAVHFAHQNLVVHRDLKPSNILITSTGMPKLLDFGIAKILGGPEGGGVETVPGHGPMTPNYASPEQVVHEPVTTVSDVYSLGVLLYRLLAGCGPYELGGAGYAEMLRVICHTEPIPPSAAVRQRAAELSEKRAGARDGSGRSELRRRERRLAGDLDAIVTKAMRKEPRQRYSSAEQLSDDLRRHRSQLPVLARRGIWSYRAGKFVRRHKVVLAALVLVFASAVSTTLLWREAVAEREQAERERSRSQAVVEFLEGLFDAADPDESHGREVTVREILDRVRDEIGEDLAQEPETQAYLLRTLGTIYNKLGLYEESLELRERALRLRQKVSSGDDPELATELANLGKLAYDLGNYEKAEGHYREALGIRQRTGQDPVEIAQTLYNLGNVLKSAGRYEEAEELQKEVLRIRVLKLGTTDILVGSALHSLGVIKYDQSHLSEAEGFLRKALAIYVEDVGPEHTRVASIEGNLGLVLQELGRDAEAERLLRKSLATWEKLLGEDHKNVAIARKRLAALLLGRGETAAAGELLTDALRVLQATLPAESWHRVDGEAVFGSYLVALGRYEEAEGYLRKGYDVSRAEKGEEAIQTRIASRRLLDLYEAWGKPGSSFPSPPPRDPRR